MSDNQEQVQEQVQVTIGAVVAAALQSVVNRGAERGEKHSFEYWLEEMVVNGCEAKKRSWNYSDETRSNKAFVKAVAALIPTDPNFAENYQKLAAKYGIGGTRA